MILLITMNVFLEILDILWKVISLVHLQVGIRYYVEKLHTMIITYIAFLIMFSWICSMEVFQDSTQSTFTSSKLTIETLEQGVKYLQS